jgi:hypothetical protein
VVQSSRARRGGGAIVSPSRGQSRGRFRPCSFNRPARRTNVDILARSSRSASDSETRARSLIPMRSCLPRWMRSVSASVTAVPASDNPPADRTGRASAAGRSLRRRALQGRLRRSSCNPTSTCSRKLLYIDRQTVTQSRATAHVGPGIGRSVTFEVAFTS